MRLLFIHQNLPGQFRHLLAHYGQMAQVQVVGLGEARRIKENIRVAIPGVRLFGYEMPEVGSGVQALLRGTDAAVTRGRAVARALLRLKQAGYSPDVIYAHPGWGESLFIKEIFPDARLVHFCEFYYRAEGQDFGFDPEFPQGMEDAMRLRARNLHHLMAVEQADEGIAPMWWQRSRFPSNYQEKISVVHDGIDTDVVKPDEKAFIQFPSSGLKLSREDEVVTFVSRNLEPYRGFHTFMRSLPGLQRLRPKAHVVIVGGDDVSYGRRLAEGSYRQKYLTEVGHRLDMSRVHFVGKVPYSVYLKVLQISSAHVYLTYPFVLSWSMMEAMAAGCIIVGSRTAPVEEVISHGDNGLLVDFFSSEAIASTVSEAIENTAMAEKLRISARKTILDRYDLHSVCLPTQRLLIEHGLGSAAAVA